MLVYGAWGNIGTYATQFVLRARLNVLATASGMDVDHIRSLGASEVIRFGAEHFEEKAQNLDAAFDLVGGQTLQRSFSTLKTGGVLVSAVSHPDQYLTSMRGVRTLFVLVEVTTVRLESIAAAIDANEFGQSVGTVLPLAAAHSPSDAGRYKAAPTRKDRSASKHLIQPGAGLIRARLRRE